MSEDQPAPRRPPREGLLLPILLPVIVLAGIGVVLWTFSRILLAVDAAAATAVALIVAAGVLALAGIASSRKRVSNGSLIAMFGGAAGIAMFAGGVALIAFPFGGEEGGPEGPVVLELAAPPGAATDGFSTQTLSGPAGRPFTIDFDNQDPEIPHNVAVFDGPDESAPVIVESEIITGPAAEAIEVPALEAGSYFFHCVVHPTTMTGTLEIAEGGGEAGGGGIRIAAANNQFDTDRIELAPDTPSVITFDNQDAGTQHNVAIYADESLSEVFFQGELVTGPITVDYEVPGIPEGEYFFRCDVHPPMNGTVLVGGEAGGESPAPEEPTPGEPEPTESPPVGGEAVTLVAQNNLFDTDQIDLIAGTPSTIVLDNLDAGIPHNVAIYADESAAESLFVGELFTGPGKIEYEVPPLDAGSYFFRCDVHPGTMTGTVTVT